MDVVLHIPGSPSSPSFSPSPEAAELDPEDAAALAELFEVVGQKQTQTTAELPWNVTLVRGSVLGEEEGIEEAFDNLLGVMTAVPDDHELNKTSRVVQDFFKDIKKALEKIAEQNTSLEVEAIHAENALQLLDIAHEGRIRALKEELAQACSERQALEERAKKDVEQTKTQVAAIESAQEEAVRLVDQTTQTQLLAEKAKYQSRLDTLEQTLDATHATLDATVRECELLAATCPDIDAVINAPDALENHGLIDSIITAGKAQGRMQENLAVKDLLRPPTEQLKEHIKKTRATMDSEAKTHV